MLPLIKTSPIIVVILTTFGILMHDMHLDKAATVAVAVPAYAESTGALEKAMTNNYHIHVERASVPRFSSSLPKVQPPRDDGKRYIQNKKLLFSGGGDTVTLWPSV